MNGRRVLPHLLSVAWVAGSAILLLGLSALIASQPKFPLNFGLVRTVGRQGLWATLLPGVVGLAGIGLVRPRKTLGAGLVLAYSGYWAILLASGLPVVWNAQSSFCLNGLGVCITIPWIGRAVLISLVVAFGLTAFWSWRLMRTARAVS